MSSERHTLHALGHGLIGLVNVAILLAILAVFLAPGSQAAPMIRSAFALLAWLVEQVVRPITGGSTIALSNQLKPAGAYGLTSTAAAATTTTTTGTGGALTVPGQTPAPGTGTGTTGTAPINLCDASGQWVGMGTPGWEGSFPAGTRAC